jgi:hypothetical protein
MQCYLDSQNRIVLVWLCVPILYGSSQHRSRKKVVGRYPHSQCNSPFSVSFDEKMTKAMGIYRHKFVSTQNIVFGEERYNKMISQRLEKLFQQTDF